MKTKSYSPKLFEHSVYYKTFSNILSIRTITAEYMVAMKLMAGRKYKNDFSDVIGILKHHKEHGIPLTLQKIRGAVEELYESWEELPVSSVSFIEQAVKKENYEEVFDEIQNNEIVNRTVLKTFEQDYPGVLSEAFIRVC